MPTDVELPQDFKITFPEHGVKDTFNEGAIRDVVRGLEAEIMKRRQVKLAVFHHFTPGIYARELHIPAGVVLTGKVHKFEHLCVMSAGDLSVLLDDGKVHRVQAPFMCISPPNTKRIAYAHTYTIWTTFHATEERDIAKLEAMLTQDDDLPTIGFKEAPCLS